ncbi:MAG: hypothetical protein ACP5JK_01855 [Candidatus Aenigmatarchaeota archaeon]|jgi:hypothetical protein
MFNKILGFGFLLTGLWLVIFFPFLDKYQPEEMSKSVALIGIVLIGIGLYFLLS